VILMPTCTPSRATTPFDIAARQALTEQRRRASLKHLYAEWDGLHCAFIYTGETLLDFPAVPTFTVGETK
jgi:hypothetical protein